jgi:hypothetical protein
MHIISPLRSHKHLLKSKRLLRLITLTSEDKDGLVPDMAEAIKELDYLVVWRKADALTGIVGYGDEEVPEPRRGIDETFD